MKTALCNLCDTQVVKVFFRVAANGRRKFVDETRRQWYGQTCPKCRYAAVKENERMSHRKCRMCAGPMSPDRYFNCTKCMRDLPEENTYEYDTQDHNGLLVHRI